MVKFDVITGAQKKAQSNAPQYTKVFAESLIAEAEADEKIVAITAAMPSGTGLDLFAKRFPKRTFDVGIAEQHAVTFAAGLATEGMKPFAVIYSTFLQRAYDQVVHDVAIQGLPVRFAMDRAGLVGADGATHAGSFDTTYLGMPAGLRRHGAVRRARAASTWWRPAPPSTTVRRACAIRAARASASNSPRKGTPLEIGKGRIVREGSKVAILSFGTRLQEALKAADELGARGLPTTVADARFCKPLDEDLIRRLAANHEVLITIEEGAIGGFASHVMQFMAKAGPLRPRLQIPPDDAARHLHRPRGAAKTIRPSPASTPRTSSRRR